MTPPPPSPRLFSGRSFTPLFIAQFGGAFNDNMLKFTLIMLATYNPSYTKSLQTLLGMDSNTVVQQLNLVASALFIVPFLAFSAVAGTMADKYPKHSFIRKTKLAEVLIVLIVGAGLFAENIYFLLLALFLLGVQSAFFGPLKYGILPELLEKEKIPPATGFMQGATFVAILAGTAVGGFLTKSDHAALFNSLMIASVAVLGYAASWFIPKLKAAAPRTKNPWSPMAEFKQTLGYAFAHRSLALGVLGLSWFWLLGSVILALLPPFTKTQLNADQSVATALIITAAIFIAIGAVACGQWVKNAYQAGYAAVCVGLNLAVLALLPKMPAAIELFTIQTLPPQAFLYFLGIMLFSVSCGFFTVPLFALLQLQSDPQHKARTIAANNIMNALFMVAGTVLTSTVIGLFGLQTHEIFLGLGLLTMLLGMYYKKSLSA